jgi:hypothetical protein
MTLLNARFHDHSTNTEVPVIIAGSSPARLVAILVRESTPVSKITRKHNELSSACKAAAQLRDVRSAFRPAGVHEADRSHEFVAAIVTTPNVLDPAR